MQLGSDGIVPQNHQGVKESTSIRCRDSCLPPWPGWQNYCPAEGEGKAYYSHHNN